MPDCFVVPSKRESQRIAMEIVLVGISIIDYDIDVIQDFVIEENTRRLCDDDYRTSIKSVERDTEIMSRQYSLKVEEFDVKELTSQRREFTAEMNENSKPIVSVLLSTYNGHQYINELVDSVLAQEGVDVRLQVRDDGSSDDTIEILKSYNDTRISIRTGKNLKPALSFLTLLRECDDSDYYAYCDQDDYWYPNKLRTAINEIRSINGPALFISTYDVCDENLCKMFTFDMKFEEPLRLQDILLYRAPSACNMVFNHALREVINRSNPSFVRMHDFWTLIVTLSHEYPIRTKAIPLIKYRQHPGECVGITPTIMTRVKRLIWSSSKGNNERWKQAKEAYDAYKDEIPEEKKDIIESIVRYRDSFENRMKLLGDKRFKTSSTYVNFLFKVAVLMGKF